LSRSVARVALILNDLCDSRYSSLGGGAGASLVHSVVAVSELVLVLRLKVVDAAATVQLTAKHLICLHETLELASQIGVLALQALCVLLESFSLGKKVAVVGAVLRLCDSKAFDVASHREEHVLLLL